VLALILAGRRTDARAHELGAAVGDDRAFVEESCIDP
jgi:hypothetical protein